MGIEKTWTLACRGFLFWHATVVHEFLWWILLHPSWIGHLVRCVLVWQCWALGLLDMPGEGRHIRSASLRLPFVYDLFVNLFRDGLMLAFFIQSTTWWRGETAAAVQYAFLLLLWYLRGGL